MSIYLINKKTQDKNIFFYNSVIIESGDKIKTHFFRFIIMDFQLAHFHPYHFYYFYYY